MNSGVFLKKGTFIMVGFLSLIFVSSCAIESSKNKRKSVFDRSETIDVDSGTQDDFDKALTFLKNSEYDEAIILLEKIIEKEQRLPAPYVNLGIAYGRKNKLDEAEKVLLKAVELNKGHPIANNELGLVLRKKGRFKDAKSAYESAISVYPNYLPAIRNLGILCEIYMRDLECALTQFEEYQKYKPEDKTVNIWVSDLKRRLSR
jgi:tetratricopeptide (TPR) repeat protein